LLEFFVRLNCLDDFLKFSRLGKRLNPLVFFQLVFVATEITISLLFILLSST